MLMLLDAPFNQYKNVVPLRINWIQKLTGLTLLLCVLLCSPWAQADGLFDFQMKLASKGNAEAEFKVGEMYETGFGVEKDMKAAREWINKAAAQGHETANFKLLYWEIESNGVKDESKNKLAELKSKANNGNPQAMYYLGKMHAYGVGVKTNYDLALDWLNKATFVGVIEAERESLIVRDLKQKALVKSRQAEAQKQAKREQAKKESQQDEQRQQAKAQRKAEEAEQLQAEARRKQQQAAQAKAYLKKISNDKQKQQAEAARQAAAQKQRQEEAAAEERRKQALLKAQAEQKKQKEKEAQFEADPCSGKSARFLSTCR
ncbi:MAG: hypothetical protein PF589_06120 [Gammaproteobacteria bacterium]|nr:hypothetical protein [Gammaproteobacteria bacterium]